MRSCPAEIFSIPHAADWTLSTWTLLNGGADAAMTAGTLASNAKNSPDARTILRLMPTMTTPPKQARSMAQFSEPQNIADDRSHYPTLLV
ncbi:hypothetical protein EMIT0P294_60127 [Pseudomonas sp. IT-P294]